MPKNSTRFLTSLTASTTAPPKRSPLGLTAAAESDSAADIPEGSIPWSGPIVVEGKMTGDGRLIERNALRWENLPLTLRSVYEDVGAHDGAISIGAIQSLERGENGLVIGKGFIDITTQEGYDAALRVEKRTQDGISVDLDDISFEVRVAAELLHDMEEGDEDIETEPTPEEDEEGRVTVIEINSGDEVMITTSARVRAATVVAIPAFIDARIKLDAELPDGPVTVGNPPLAEVASLAAAAAPLSPPADWFSNPGLTQPTPLYVTDDGRVYGHLATWGTCHTAHVGQCVEPPRSATGYAYFLTGTTQCSDGSEVATGRLTMDTSHAAPRLNAAAASCHYDDTGAAVADVAIGEDEVGIWVSGAVRPRATGEQRRVLRASPLSGDWRRIGGNLELVAALAVNVPGFPIPRTGGLVASGDMYSLVASGMVVDDDLGTEYKELTGEALSSDDLNWLKALANRERRNTVDGLVERVNATKASALARRVERSRA